VKNFFFCLFLEVKMTFSGKRLHL